VSIPCCPPFSQWPPAGSAAPPWRHRPLRRPRRRRPPPRMSVDPRRTLPSPAPSRATRNYRESPKMPKGIRPPPNTHFSPPDPHRKRHIDCSSRLWRAGRCYPPKHTRLEIITRPPKCPFPWKGIRPHLTRILARPTHAANGTSTGPVVCEGQEDVTLPKNCQFSRGNSGPT